MKSEEKVKANKNKWLPQNLRFSNESSDTNISEPKHFFKVLVVRWTGAGLLQRIFSPTPLCLPMRLSGHLDDLWVCVICNGWQPKKGHVLIKLNKGDFWNGGSVRTRIMWMVQCVHRLNLWLFTICLIVKRLVYGPPHVGQVDGAKVGHS